MASRWKRDAGIACVAAGVGAGMHAYYCVGFVSRDAVSAAATGDDVGAGPSPETAASTDGPCSLSLHGERASPAGASSTIRFSASPVRPRRNMGVSTTSPILPIAIIRPNDNLEIAFDTATKNPIYVLERFSRDGTERPKPFRRPGMVEGDTFDGTNRNNRFHEESSLPWNYRSRNSHYRRSGYDRGHLAPAADFRDRRIINRDDDDGDTDGDDDGVRDTYNLCNVSPQVSSFNRGPWANLERVVRRIVREELDIPPSGGKDDVAAIVITGPLFLPSEIVSSADGDGGPPIINDKFRFSHLAIGRPPSLVTVPTHFFKVVAIADGGRVRKVAAFVLPNVEDVSPEWPALTAYLVTPSDLETVTGMEFFPGMWGSNVEKEGGRDDDYRENFGKDFADALTEDLRDRPGNKIRDLDTPVLSNSSSLDNRKMRKIQKRMKKDEAFRLRHLCEGGRCDF